MGMAAGGGLFLVSGIACAIFLLALVFLVYVEDLLDLKPRYMLFRIYSASDVDLVPEIHQLFSSLDIALDNFQVSMTGEKNLIQFDADVSHRKQEKILTTISRPGVVCEMLPVERHKQ